VAAARAFSAAGGSGPLRRTARTIVRALRFPFAFTLGTVRRATNAHGAGESGLAKLIELHGVNGAGDVMITVALASTVFFSVPTDEARGRVALYLAVTMAPFTLLAPVIGPLLDRVPHGRRAAMATAMLARALLALLLSNAVVTGGLVLYPAALGVLVASKAYGVVRSAVVPRLLPPRFSLVKANSRVTLCGLLATGVAAPIGAWLHLLGPRWPLYGACVIFTAGTVLSFQLPHVVDSGKGEDRALLAADEEHLRGPRTRLTKDTRRTAIEPGRTGRRGLTSRLGRLARLGRLGYLGRLIRTSHTGRTSRMSRTGRMNHMNRSSKEQQTNDTGQARRPGLRSVGPAVTHALAANAVLRCLSGFLIFFLAFLLREHPLAGQSAAVSLGMAGVAAGAGNALGTAVGAWLKSRAPEMIIVTVVALTLGVSLAAAGLFSTVLVAALAAVAGFAQALAKLSLDALIQRDVPEEVRTSAFARSETLLQMAWVAGGAIGIALPLNGTLGLWVGAAIVSIGWLTTVRGLLRSARHGSPFPRTRVI
jgi:MFS family permease